MHLVTNRAVFRRIFADERLHERHPVRFGIQIRQEIPGFTQNRVVAGRKTMQGRIHHGEPAVSHGALDVHDRMTGYAAEAVLRLRRVELFFRCFQNGR